MNDSPFLLANEAAYRRWRDSKLAVHPATLAELVVEVGDPRRLTPAEQAALADRLRRCNMVIYAGTTGADADKDIPRRVGAAFGLHRLDANYLSDEDGISPIAVAPVGTRGEFIPYTSRGIKWHTDGYYNTLDRQVHGLVLHCVRSAQSGGENRLMDHEMAYLRLRDENPDFIRELMARDAMVIPARMEGEQVARPEQAGPVFAVAPDGHLHMRYTQRATNVIWRPSAKTALDYLDGLLADEGTACSFRALLAPGMGLICNNVLHDRSAFTDDPAAPRLLYRARYHDRITLPA